MSGCWRLITAGPPGGMRGRDPARYLHEFTKRESNININVLKFPNFEIYDCEMMAGFNGFKY